MSPLVGAIATFKTPAKPVMLNQVRGLVLY